MADVLIPFLAGLLFGRGRNRPRPPRLGLNPLFGGSAFRTQHDRERAQPAPPAPTGS